MREEGGYHRWYGLAFVRFEPFTKREVRAYRRPLDKDGVELACRLLLGEDGEPVSARELGGGYLNDVYLVERAALPSVVLKIAPPAEVRFVSERYMLRNEAAALSRLVPLGDLVPQLISTHFGENPLGRDLLAESLLSGTPGWEQLSCYDTSLWRLLYAQMGEVSRRVHSIEGEGYGPAADPCHASWSEALLASLDELLTDLRAEGFDDGSLGRVRRYVSSNASLFDDVGSPRLCHGDLWTNNVMMDPESDRPSLTGIFDTERAFFGDPMADWIFHRIAGRKVPEDAAGFWSGYGPGDPSAEAAIRAQVYEARHLASVVIEDARAGLEDLVEEAVASLAGIATSL